MISILESVVIRNPTAHTNELYVHPAKLFFASRNVMYFGSNNKHKEKATIYKYLVRSKLRSTPFALFASIGVAKLENRTALTLDQSSYVPHFKLSFETLRGLTLKLVKFPEIRKAIKYKINSTGYTLNNQFRYWEFDLVKNSNKFTLQSIEIEPHIQLVLNTLKNEISYTDFFNIFKLYFQEHEIDKFLTNLIDSQVIIPGILPKSNGNNNLGLCFDILKNVMLYEKSKSKDLSDFIHSINKISILLNDLHKYDEDSLVEKLIILETAIAELLPDSPRNPVVCNTYTNFVENKLSTKTVSQIQRGFTALQKIGQIGSDENIVRFKDSFRERWQDQRIPLAVALDLEFGLNYPVNNSNNINHILNRNLFKHVYSRRKLKDDSFESFWLEKILSASKESSHLIDIRSKDLPNLNEGIEIRLPATFSVLTSPFDCDGEILKIDTFGGNTGIFMISRFAENPDIKNICDHLSEYESSSYKPVVPVEVSCMPGGPKSDIVSSESFRDFEIVCMGIDTNPSTQRVNVSDIEVSVENNHVLLWHKSTKQQIIPLSSNAYNFHVSDNYLYRFLGSVGASYFSYVTNLNLDFVRSKTDFIPRIVLDKDVILFEAQWKLIYKDFKDNDSYLNYRSTLQLKNVPQHSIVYDHDTFILVDYEDEISLDIFRRLLKLRKEIWLTEFSVENSSPVRNLQGKKFKAEYVHFLKAQLPYIPISTYKSETDVHRDFFPGDSWLSLKIYTTEGLADKIIQFVSSKLEFIELKPELFFFLRYKDPNFHLRLRFKCEDSLLFYNYFYTLIGELIQAKIIIKIEIDSYSREIERYGPQIDLIEKIFFLDSTIQLKFLKEDFGYEQRIIFSMAIIDAYVSAYGYSPEDKKSLFSDPESVFSTPDTRQIDLFYKQNMQLFLTGLGEWREELKNFCNEIKTCVSKIQNKDSVFPSLIHMSVNRTFPIVSHNNDFMVQYLLGKIYSREFYTSK